MTYSPPPFAPIKGQLAFDHGDTAVGIKITEPWTGVVSAVFHMFNVNADGNSTTPVAGFDGAQAMYVANGQNNTTDLEYAWTSPPPVGVYRIDFTATYSDGRPETTSTYELIVRIP